MRLWRISFTSCLFSCFLVLQNDIQIRSNCSTTRSKTQSGLDDDDLPVADESTNSFQVPLIIAPRSNLLVTTHNRSTDVVLTDNSEVHEQPISNFR